MYTIKTMNSIAKVGLARLGGGFEVNNEAEAPEGIMLRSYKLADAEVPASTLAIARAGAGTNNIDVAAASERGIVVFNTPGANANAVKELVLAALLLTSRDIVGGADWCRTLSSAEGEISKQIESGKKAFVGPEIKGKTLGVIGLGAIGAMVANDASALGMTVMGFDPYISVDNAWHLSRKVRRAASLEELYAEADYITVHVPLMDSTRGSIGATAFGMMKKGVRLLNFSRGEIVDTEALLAAIADGTVAKYATDFPTEAMLGMKQIVALPHLGASTPESEDNCAVMAADEIRDYILYGSIVNSVNMPRCALSTPVDCRLCVIHRNTPNMIGQMTAILAGGGMNIEGMTNVSRGNYAYSVFELATLPDAAQLAAINAIDGVLKVRTIG